VTDSPRDNRSGAKPKAEPSVRESGPVEGVRGNREVPPAPVGATEQTVAAESEPDVEARLAAAQAEAESHLNDLKRLAAEFDNYRKRALREQQAFAARANERVVKELLPVLDDLERAAKPPVRDSGPREGVRGNRVEVPPTELGAPDPPSDYEGLLEGVRLVHRALEDVLRKEGLAEIETDGAFDPHVHEALLTQPGDEVEPGQVLQVLQKGYRLGDRVLRPARVIVAE
jgi:molecular chaperone GrpE